MRAAFIQHGFSLLPSLLEQPNKVIQDDDIFAKGKTSVIPPGGVTVYLNTYWAKRSQAPSPKVFQGPHYRIANVILGIDASAPASERRELLAAFATLGVPVRDG